MKTSRTASLWILALFALIFARTDLSAQQGQQKNPSAPVERKVVTGEAGMQQWAPYEAPTCIRCKGSKTIECPTCKGAEFAVKCGECGTRKEPRTKKAPCRLCAGEGKMPDPLVEAPCLGCFGSSRFPCFGCGGNGNYPVEGGGKKRQKCAVCRGEGSLACSICKGKRRCDALSVRKGLADASLKDLKAALELVEKALADIRAFQPTGVKARKELKAYQATLKAVTKVCKVARKASSAIKSLQSLVSKMDQYRGFEDRKMRVFKTFADYNAFYFDHQLQALKLAIQRAEHNAEVAKNSKSK